MIFFNMIFVLIEFVFMILCLYVCFIFGSVLYLVKKVIVFLLVLFEYIVLKDVFNFFIFLVILNLFFFNKLYNVFCDLYFLNVNFGFENK